MDLSSLLNNTKIKQDISDEEDISNDEPDKNIINMDDRFNHPWNKLEKGPKLNRLLLFIEKERNDNSLNEDQVKRLKSLLFKACDDNMLNKISDVEYDLDNMEIKTIKNLTYNENTKHYKIRTTTGKQRSVTKSKSQLDRLMKKK